MKCDKCNKELKELTKDYYICYNPKCEEDGYRYTPLKGNLEVEDGK
jgi:Zn finger protein HypA/HybF involved in hydrogenase expression